MSLLNQTIHLLQLREDGVFVKIQDLGWFCNDTDEITFLLAREAEIVHGVAPKNTDMDTFISQEPNWILSGLKERIIARMYKDCLESKDSKSALSLFYRKFDKLVSLILWKFQILDDDHLLLKLSADDSVSWESCLLVVYNLKTTQVLSVSSNSSQEFIHTYEANCSNFKTCSSAKGFTHTISNDFYWKRNHKILLNNIHYLYVFFFIFSFFLFLFINFIL